MQCVQLRDKSNMDLLEWIKRRATSLNFNCIFGEGAIGSIRTVHVPFLSPTLHKLSNAIHDCLCLLRRSLLHILLICYSVLTPHWCRVNNRTEYIFFSIQTISERKIVCFYEIKYIYWKKMNKLCQSKKKNPIVF